MAVPVAVFVTRYCQFISLNMLVILFGVKWFANECTYLKMLPLQAEKGHQGNCSSGLILKCCKIVYCDGEHV